MSADQNAAATSVLYRCVKEMLAQGIERDAIHASLSAVLEALPPDVTGVDDITYRAVADVLSCLDGWCSPAARL